MLNFLFTVLVLMNSTSATGWSFEEFQEKYRSGQFENALDLLVKKEPKSAEDFFNLGLVYLRLERVGASLSAFEKARSLNPFQRRVHTQLEFTQEKLFQRKGYFDREAASRWYEKWGDRLPTTLLIGLVGVVFAILGSIILGKLALKKPIGQVGFFEGLIWGAFALSLTALVLRYAAIWNPPLTCQEDTEIRTGPGTEFVVLKQVPEGMKLRLLNAERESWYQVRYTPSAVGWVPKSTQVRW